MAPFCFLWFINKATCYYCRGSNKLWERSSDVFVARYNTLPGAPLFLMRGAAFPRPAWRVARVNRNPVEPDLHLRAALDSIVEKPSSPLQRPPRAAGFRSRENRYAPQSRRYLRNNPTGASIQARRVDSHPPPTTQVARNHRSQDRKRDCPRSFSSPGGPCRATAQFAVVHWPTSLRACFESKPQK